MSPPIDRCPTCEERGKDVRGHYESRVTIGGRGFYICPECEERWQNADETPHSQGKDFPIRGNRP